MGLRAGTPSSLRRAHYPGGASPDCTMSRRGFAPLETGTTGSRPLAQSAAPPTLGLAEGGVSDVRRSGTAERAGWPVGRVGTAVPT
eukprot:4625467-Alexandrium_andersonii.AAC.1